MDEEQIDLVVLLVTDWSHSLEAARRNVARRTAHEDVVEYCPLEFRCGLGPKETAQEADEAIDELKDILADKGFDNEVLGMIVFDAIGRAEHIYTEAKEELEQQES